VGANLGWHETTAPTRVGIYQRRLPASGRHYLQQPPLQSLHRALQQHPVAGQLHPLRQAREHGSVMAAAFAQVALA
jgi:hypothetical protein